MKIIKYKIGDIVVLKKYSEHYSNQGFTMSEEPVKRLFKINEVPEDHEKAHISDKYCYELESIIEGDIYNNIYSYNDIEYSDKKLTNKEELKPIKKDYNMKSIKNILEKVYENDELRKTVVPLFIGDPGTGKTKIIESFAKEKGANIVEIIVSQVNPFEVSGMAMPDRETKKMTYFDFDNLESLKDGDILFFDEVFNGNPVVLNACLTLLESRRMVSGKNLPNVMIIAAANPQGMVPLTPQIKERFVWYHVKFDQIMWQSYMDKKYEMPYEVSSKLSRLILEEKFVNNNFFTARSVDKAISMIKHNCPTPYEGSIDHILTSVIENKNESRILVSKEHDIWLEPRECINWKNILKNKPEKKWLEPLPEPEDVNSESLSLKEELDDITSTSKTKKKSKTGTKKKRKIRSDKGIKRGPKVKKSEDTSLESPAEW